MEDFKNLPKISKGSVWKRADKIWFPGYKGLLIMMKKVFEQKPTVIYPGADGRNYPLVRLENGTYYMADTPEALGVMEVCLRQWEEREPDMMIPVYARGSCSQNVKIKEYIRRYHNSCCVPSLPEDEEWKRCRDIWRHGCEALGEIVEEIFEKVSQGEDLGIGDVPREFVGRFRPKAGTVTCYIKETPDALRAIERYILKCAKENPERTTIIATDDKFGNYLRKEISLEEYARRYHAACLVPELPENAGWMTAHKIWSRGYETLLKIMADIFERVPKVTYRNEVGKEEPLVCKFRNGQKITYYMKNTPEALQAMGKYLENYIVKCPCDSFFSIIRSCDGKEYGEEVSGNEYFRCYYNACLVPEVPKKGEWKVASGVWRNGTKYGFGQIMKEAFEKGWKDASGNLLVQHFRNGVEISYYMKDTPESLSAMHEKMMLLAIFDPEHGTKSNLRKTLKSFTTYLLKKDLGLSVGCPKTEDDWDQAQDAWKKEAKEAYPNQTPAEGLRIYIQEKTGVVFTPEIMEKCFAEDPQKVANQQAERDFYEKHPNLKPKGNSR